MEQGRAQRSLRRFLFFLLSGKLLFPPLNISFLLISRPPPPLSHSLSPLHICSRLILSFVSYSLPYYLLYFSLLLSPLLSFSLFFSLSHLIPHDIIGYTIFSSCSLLLIPSSFATTVHLSLILIGPLSNFLLFPLICLL